MTADVFDHIYRTNAWNGVESRSGPGSGPAATERVAGDILRLVEELSITSVLDVGCGDGYWMPDLPGYVGIDASREAIALARRNHPGRSFDVYDGRHLALIAGFELVIVRDTIQHVSLADGVIVLTAVRRCGARWLLASTYRGGENVDIAAGDCFSPDLTAPPFDLGQPERLIFDGWAYHDSTLVRDPRKFLGLWRLS